MAGVVVAVAAAAAQGQKTAATDKQRDADYDEDVDDEEEEDVKEDATSRSIGNGGRKALAKSRRVPVMDFMCVIYCIIPFPLSWRVYAFVCFMWGSLMLWLFFLLRRDSWPLSGREQKKRVVGKRARFEKNGGG